MAKPRYRSQKVVKSVQGKPLESKNDFVGQRDASVLKPDNGAISIAAVGLISAFDISVPIFDAATLFGCISDVVIVLGFKLSFVNFVSAANFR